MQHCIFLFSVKDNAGQGSAVGNVSDCRYLSDCRSRSCEFELDLVPTFLETDHEIISTAILLPSAYSRKVVISLQAKVCARSTV